MSFPETRPRRLRRTEALRRMVRETTLSASNLMYPLFICPGQGMRKEIPALPGQYHLSVDQLAREAEDIARLGIPSVMLFGLPEKKDSVGSEAWHTEGVVQRADNALKIDGAATERSVLNGTAEGLDVDLLQLVRRSFLDHRLGLVPYARRQCRGPQVRLQPE